MFTLKFSITRQVSSFSQELELQGVATLTALRLLYSENSWGWQISEIVLIATSTHLLPWHLKYWPLSVYQDLDLWWHQYNKSPTYEWGPFQDHILTPVCKSNKVSLGTQLTQLDV